MNSPLAKLVSNPRALIGIAGVTGVFVISLLASTAVDATLVVPVAVAAAFAAGLVIRPNRSSDAEREAERRRLGAHLDRQVRSGRKLSILDPQTAMLQRWYFELRVAEEARRCRRYGTSMALVFVKVEDASDPEKVWKQEDEIDFVQMFARTLRSVDLAARINEREYAVCMPHTAEEGADTAAIRLISNSGAYDVTAFLSLCPRDGIDYETLVERAQVFKPPAPARVSKKGAAAGKKPSASLQLVNLLGTTNAGEVSVPDGGTAKATKAQLRRASKRAGVEIRIWEENGTIHFERAPEPLRQRGAA